MKTTKRLLSVLLAIVLLFSTTSASLFAFAGPTDAYIDGGRYYRWSNGAYIECLLSYDEMIESFQNGILKLDKKGDTLHIYYAMEGSVDSTDEEAKAQAERELEKKIETDVFTHNENNPMLGGYGFSSTDVTCSANLFPMNYDTEIDGVQYNTYGIFLSFEHHNTPAEEKYVQKFAELFTRAYIPETATDYEKVKTIYDFVIRNCEYDYELYEASNSGEFSDDSDRFRISHSAYGALVGNHLQYLTDDKSKLNSNSDLNIGYENYSDESLKNEFISKTVELDFSSYFGYKEAITGEKIVELEMKNNNTVSNGKAVCEGYSKLFYYLCVYNGIPSRIVDGDYIEYISEDQNEIKDLYGDLKSEKESNPHEWNYVLLDGKWYIVDTTFSSQISLKNVDLNSYEFFLIGTKYTVEGTINPTFSVKNHQQPYVQNGPKYQLYDWYLEENAPSDTDYSQPLININNYVIGEDQSVIIERKTNYGDGDKCAYLLQNSDSAVRISINEDQTMLDNVGGFDYNGKKTAQYTLIIPYLTKREYKTKILTGIKDAGQYTLKATGAEVGGKPSEFNVKFKIVPIDMSNNSTNYSEIQINNEANYTGQAVSPQISITDGHNNRLTKDDYVINVYQNGKPVELKEMGDYNVSIDFKGNYSGSYKLNFRIGKIDLSTIAINEYALPYIPKFYRQKENITQASDFFNSVSNLQIGTKKLLYGTDYLVSSKGSIANYGDKGTLIISAVPTSSLVLEGSKNTGTYTVSEKFDISGNSDADNGVNLNGEPADSNSVNRFFYDGTAKKPTRFDNLEKTLEKGKDYKIVSYSNNVNAGKAYVTIQGINGCTGKATMYFKINPANITTAKVTTSYSGTTLNVKLVHNGKTLVKGTDYKQTVEKKSNGYLVTIQGINNYAGTLKLTCSSPTTNYVKPSASGNKVKLSKSTYVYSGSACKPTVTLINSSGKTVNTYYYTVKYSSNVYVGTAKATLTFRNGYSGSVTVTYQIIPKGTTISSLSAVSKGFTVKWKKQSTQTSGYQIQIATNSGFSKGVKTYTVSGSSTVSKKITKLLSKKKYYVRIRTYKTVSGKNYYSSWSASKYVTTKK